MTQITRVEAQHMLSEIGHVANITVPTLDENNEETYRSVLNDAIVYNPYQKFQIGGASNEDNAISAMRFINDKFEVYSSYFNWANGEYEITD